MLILALVTMMVPLEAGASIPTRTENLTKSAFGELLAHTGSDPQPYAFTGEPYDPNSGWQYHRARWMDPRTGQFVAMDTFPGLEFEPSSLHRYAYVAANPVSSVDPSGLTNLTTLSIASGMIISLAARATPFLLAGQRAIHYTVMRGPDILGRLDAYLTLIAGGAATIELAARWSSVALSGSFPYSAGPAPRGIEFGDVLGQNLTDVNEGIDHWEFGGGGRKDVAAQIFSTTQTDNPEQLLRAIEQKATKLSALNSAGDTELHFNSGRLLPVTGRQMRAAEKLLFVGISEDPLPWNPQPFLANVQVLMRRLRVGICVVPVNGLRKTK